MARKKSNSSKVRSFNFLFGNGTIIIPLLVAIVIAGGILMVGIQKHPKLSEYPKSDGKILFIPPNSSKKDGLQMDVPIAVTLTPTPTPPPYVQSSYYSESSYPPYTQSTYPYSQTSYYSQSSYGYSQSGYYSESSYYNQPSYQSAYLR